MSLFQTKEEELDALSTARSSFTDIQKTLLQYQNIAANRREYQEKALAELRTLQQNIKNNKIITENEKRKLEKDIEILENEYNLLKQEQEETLALLKKFYQQEYIRDIQGEEDVSFMKLLLPKSF